MGDYGLAALSGILGGLQGLPQGMLNAQKVAQTQQQLDEAARHNLAVENQQSTPVEQLYDVTGAPRPATLKPGERLPNHLATILGTKLVGDQERQRKAAIGQDIGNQVREAGTTVSMAPGASLSMPQPGALLAPPPAGPMPEISQKTVDPKMAALAKMIPGLLQTDSGAATALLKDTFAPKPPQIVSENAIGTLSHTGQYTPLPGAGAPADFTPPVGYKPTFDVNPRGRVTTHYRDAADRPERTLSERLAMAEDQARANPTQENLAAAARMRDAFKNEEKLARARAGAAQDVRPVEEGDRVALAAQNNILASTELFKQFKPEEIKAYVGLLNRPMAEVKQALAATFGMGQVDQRFADFKALMGRLQGTAFGEGGKQLTGLELSIVQLYTPTGREPGGVPEIMAKVKNLEAFTRIARATRIKMAQTGRSALNPDQFDAELRAAMQKAGLTGTATETPDLPGAVSEADAAFGQVKKNFKQWQQEQQRRP